LLHIDSTPQFSFFIFSSLTLKWKDYRIEGPDRYKTMLKIQLEFNRTAGKLVRR